MVSGTLSQPSPLKGRRLLAALLLLVPTSATAQQSATSSGPQAVSVTIYRNQNGGSGGEVNLRWLQGYALITETRTVNLPAGDVQLRFEGVAEGIIPVSAIVTGLPGGVIQKNRDAAIISPAALLNGSLGNRVLLRRTNKVTGKVDEQEAIIRSSAGQGIVVETQAGVQALKCGSGPEAIIYPQVPEGLSATPTLSVLTRSTAPVIAKVQLSYLARNFDWAANYVAHVDMDKNTLDLAAWLTLANGNGESFVQADTQAVAGTVNRDQNAKLMEQRAPAPAVTVRCWPMDVTSTHPLSTFEREQLVGAADGMMYEMAAAPMPVMAMPAPAPQARKAMMARQEELGDLKLYRIPEPVTVAAHAQKQVAMIEKSAVPFERLYEINVWAGSYYGNNQGQASQILRLKNITKKGLGLPLPSGSVALFETVDGAHLLAARAPMKDSAVGEEVEIAAGASPQVRWSTSLSPQGQYVEITNANPRPVTVEASFDVEDGKKLKGAGAKLPKKDGRPLWRVSVPANGSARLDYGTP